MVKNHKKNRVVHVPFVSALLILCVVIGQQLVTHPQPFYDWDESIYMRIGMEMVHNKSLQPTWNGTPWLEKPPLIPALYGLSTFLPWQAEVDARLLALALGITALAFIYLWSYRITNHVPLASAITTVTAFTDIFFQRLNVVNADSILLISWLGYFLTLKKNTWWGMAFLTIGILSKSFLGLYPVFAVILYYYIDGFTYRKGYRAVWQYLKTAFIQLIPSLLWYAYALIRFQGLLIQEHIVDHMARRVLSSVESHFGARTFYIDLIIQQFGWWCLFILLGLVMVMYRFRHNSKSWIAFTALSIVPFYVFLNLTKTKIAWYVYPTIPQIVLLMLYPLTYIRKYYLIASVVSMVIIGMIVYRAVYTDHLFEQTFAHETPHITVAKQAREMCKKLYVIPDATSRETYETLSNLGLVLTTTTRYGNRPTVAYYFGEKTLFQYNLKTFAPQRDDCIMVEQEDVKLLPQNLTDIKQMGSVYLKKRV